MTETNGQSRIRLLKRMRDWPWVSDDGQSYENITSFGLLTFNNRITTFSDFCLC